MSFFSTLNVREKPPLRLIVEVNSPSGRHMRLGDRLHDPRHSPQSLTFSTTMPGGFETASFSLANPWWQEITGLELLSTVQIVGPHGGLAWEGRLDQLPDTSGISEVVSPQLAGWQNHLADDDSVTGVYLEQDLTAWKGPSNTEQKWLTDNHFTSETFNVGRDKAGYPALQMVLAKGPYSHPNEPRCEAWYDAGEAKIAAVWYDLTFGSNVTDSHFGTTFGAGDDDHQTALSEFTTNLFSGGSEVQSTWQMTGKHRFVRLYFQFAKTPWGSNQPHVEYARIALIGDHGIPVVAGNPIGLLASDIIAHAIRTWCPMLSFTKGRDGTLQPSKFPIPQLAYTSPTTVSQVVDDVVTYENLDWAVWDGRTFYLGERGQLASTRRWQARVGSANLQEAGAQASRLWNGVIVSYTNQAGNTVSIGPPDSGLQLTDARLKDPDPQNPANQVGIKRYDLIQVGLSPTTSDKLAQSEAVRAGEVFLGEQKKLDRSGSATITGHVLDDRGIMHPYWKVRAGDYISFTDAHDTSYRRIVSTSCDDSSKQNAIQLDTPPDTLSALLQRLSVQVHKKARQQHHHPKTDHHHH